MLKFQKAASLMENPSDEITGLLIAWGNGDKMAIDKLMPFVYQELHRLAHIQLAKERRGHTLQTTGLVHEAYMKLIDQTRVQWQNRAQFFAIASKLMRRILIDYARSRNYSKRKAAANPLPLNENRIGSSQRAAEMVALDDALNALYKHDERKGQIVELRFFGGLSIEETAEVLGVSPGTVMKDWTLAKAWLQKEIGTGGSS
jgi:RNA polymerase sigma factor (TIGR02999 family)